MAMHDSSSMPSSQQTDLSRSSSSDDIPGSNSSGDIQSEVTWWSHDPYAPLRPCSPAGEKCEEKPPMNLDSPSNHTQGSHSPCEQTLPGSMQQWSVDDYVPDEAALDPLPPAATATPTDEQPCAGARFNDILLPPGGIESPGRPSGDAMRCDAIPCQDDVTELLKAPVLLNGMQVAKAVEHPPHHDVVPCWGVPTDPSPAPPAAAGTRWVITTITAPTQTWAPAYADTAAGHQPQPPHDPQGDAHHTTSPDTKAARAAPALSAAALTLSTDPAQWSAPGSTPLATGSGFSTPPSPAWDSRYFSQAEAQEKMPVRNSYPAGQQGPQATPSAGNSPVKSPGPASWGGDECSVYAKGIDSKLQEAELFRLLWTYGAVSHVRICGDPCNTTLFGFFTFEESEAARRLISECPLRLGRKVLNCEWNKQKANTEFGSIDASFEPARVPLSKSRLLQPWTNGGDAPPPFPHRAGAGGGRRRRVPPWGRLMDGSAH